MTSVAKTEVRCRKQSRISISTKTLERVVIANTKRGRRPTAAASLLLLATVLSCTVADNEVAGTWSVESSSRAKLSEALARAAARFRFEVDHTFTATEIPDSLLYDSKKTEGGPLTGKGEWSLVSRDGGQKVRLRFTEISSGQRGSVPFESELEVSKGTEQVLLYYYIGDPDSARIVRFQKQ
jgi:hypothetical protein